MRTEDMTPEQLEEAKALQTPEEMLAYARDNGIDLTDEEMDAIAGGGAYDDGSKICPHCGSCKTVLKQDRDNRKLYYRLCHSCGRRFGEKSTN